MLYNYGFSVIGKSHIAKGACCQDSHAIKELENGWVVAAVADGVGSAKNSQIGSKIAAEIVVDFCAKYMPPDYSIIGIKSMLRTAYNYALKQIIKESEKTGEPLESYDTTLTTVIYDGHRIIYGHSGDGAIIGLTVFGDYIKITAPQKGEDLVSVIPLRAGYTSWVIDSYEEELAAVMLMTDGMLDYVLCPYLLNLSEEYDVYTPIATFFADPYGVPKNIKEWNKVKNEILEFITMEDSYDYSKFYSRLEKIYKKRLNKETAEVVSTLYETKYSIAFMRSADDDKTLVTLINPALSVETKRTDYYSEPDWAELQERWNKKAYPHLYSDHADLEEDEECDKKLPENDLVSDNQSADAPDSNNHSDSAVSFNKEKITVNEETEILDADSSECQDALRQSNPHNKEKKKWLDFLHN